MCELFAMSSRLPAAVTFSLETLSRHSGGKRLSCDGWGVAFYDGHDARVLREPQAACESSWIDFIENNGPHSRLVISHIRHATAGSIGLANTHPFARPLGGRLHTFAHNGILKSIIDWPGFSIGRHRPIGETDSEWAFCSLLARLDSLWMGDAPPSPITRREIVAEYAAELKQLGPANFLYADGDYLFAFSDRRRQEDGRFAAPGLHILSRHCNATHGDAHIGGVSVDSGTQSILLIASVPLSDEAWMPISEGELLMLRQGEIVEHSVL